MKKILAVLITSALLTPAPQVASAAIRVNFSAGGTAAQGSAAGAGITRINSSIANPSLSNLKVGSLNSTLSAPTPNASNGSGAAPVLFRSMGAGAGIHLPSVQINSVSAASEEVSADFRSGVSASQITVPTSASRNSISTGKTGVAGGTLSRTEEGKTPKPAIRAALKSNAAKITQAVSPSARFAGLKQLFSNVRARKGAVFSSDQDVPEDLSPETDFTGPTSELPEGPTSEYPNEKDEGPDFRGPGSDGFSRTAEEGELDRLEEEAVLQYAKIAESGKFSDESEVGKLRKAVSKIEKIGGEEAAAAIERIGSMAKQPEAVAIRQGLKKAVESTKAAEGKSDESAAKTGKFWSKAIIALIAGLLIAQVATEFFGQSMPQLIKSTFGDFSIYASVMFFSLIGRTLGNAAGGILPDKLGLKRTYLTAEIGRAISLGVLVILLITGQATLPIYFAISTINGFFTGMTLTAESSIPRVILGNNQRLLEKFYGWYQWTLEFAGIGAPLVAGYIISQTGTFAWTLGAYPFILALAILFFALMMNHPKISRPAGAGGPSKLTRALGATVMATAGVASVYALATGKAAMIGASIVGTLGISASVAAMGVTIVLAAVALISALGLYKTLRSGAKSKKAVAAAKDEAAEKPAEEKEQIPATWTKRYKVIAITGAVAAVVSAVTFSGVLPFLAAGGILGYLTAAVASLMTIIAGLRYRASRRAAKGRKHDFLDSVDAALGEVLTKFTEGAAIALKTPALRTAVLAEGGFIALNGFLYALIAPAYGLFIMHSATLAPSVQAFIVALYSLGSMLGAVIMLKLNGKVGKKVDRWLMSSAEEDSWMRRSALRWMMIGAFSLAAFLPLAVPMVAPSTFLFGIPGLWTGIIPIYAGMVLFGILSVVPGIKLKSLAARLTPSDSVPKVMGFIQLMASILIAFSVWGMSNIFDIFVDANDFPTSMAFWVMNGVLMAVMAGLLAARHVLKRQLGKVPLAGEEEEGADGAQAGATTESP